MLTGRSEVLRLSEFVAAERGMSTADVLAVLAKVFEKIARERYGLTYPIRAVVDRTTGDVVIVRGLVPSEGEEVPPEQSLTTVSVRDLDTAKAEVDLGLAQGKLEKLPGIEMNRTTARSVRHWLLHFLQDIERSRQYEQFKDRIGQLVVGSVKRVDFGHVILEVERTEAFLRRDELIPGEVFHSGERVQAVILDVRREEKGYQVFISRRHATFLMRLFEQEVPEVEDGTVILKAVARDAGSRAKVAVFSQNPTVDPVAACVGIRGSRIQAISREARNEKIDMLVWSSDLATLVANALSSVEILKIVLEPRPDPQKRPKLRIVVSDEHKSLAIGRGGQNVRLASEIAGVFLEVVGEVEEAAQRAEDMAIRIPALMEALDIDEVMARLLYGEGFGVDEIIDTPEDVFLDIGGFTDDLVAELKRRALEYRARCQTQTVQQFLDDGGDPQLPVLLEGRTSWMPLLMEAGVTTVVDVARLSVEELMDIMAVDEEEAEFVISQAQRNELPVT